MFLGLDTLISVAQTYPTASAKSDKKYYIDAVSFAGINNSGTNRSSYSDFTSSTAASVHPGLSYSLNITLRDKKSDNYLTVWIDWNHNYSFEASEKYVITSGTAGGLKTTSIEVPNSASIATTRMRIIVIEATAPSATGNQGGNDGEVEDYSVNISTPANREDLMYYVSDGDNKLYIINTINGACSEIGNTNLSYIEAIANWPAHSENQLYAADAGDFVSLNTATGASTLIGEIDGGGVANGANGAQQLNDVDGLAFDARTGILWASNRRGGTYDLMFQIDIKTGHFVEDAFGLGIDYIVIDGVGVNYDIDDISISPVTGEMFVVNNNSGSNDQILKINKSTGAIEVTTLFADLNDVEGCDFAFDGTFYVSEGGGNSLSTASTTSGASSFVNSSLCGGGDVEALASLVSETNTMEGNVWIDTDADGNKDAGETSGINNVEVDIYYDANGDGIINGSDEFLNSVKTDASGNWTFDYATTGHLIAKINETTLPIGYALTGIKTQTANFTTSGSYDSNNDFGALNGTDSDGDGIPDFKEGTSDSDGDGIRDYLDLDSDNDGITDLVEGTIDTDADGILDYLDLDSDNDGIPDALEANGGAAPDNYNISTARIGGSDSDGDGLMNSVDAGSTSKLSNYDSDGDGVRDYRDLDSDNDGILDIVEAGGTDANGDGTVDAYVDSNGDGYNDSYASSPLPIYNNDAESEPVFLPNYRDIDSDGDSIDDSREGYSPEGYKVPTIIKDSDGDGILDFYDISEGGTSITPYDFDSDGVPDYQDLDSDNDTGSDMIEGNDANGDNLADTSPLGMDANNNGLDDAFDKNCTGVSNEELSYNIAERLEEAVSSGSTYDASSSSDIELTYEAKAQIIGLRYTGIGIDNSETITNAYIQFQVDEVTSGAITLKIKAEDVDNSAVLVRGSNNYNVSNRTVTSSLATWSPASWDNIGDTGPAQRTVDISNLIQEVVDRPGWINGNAITIIISSADNTDTDHRTAENTPILYVSTASSESTGLKYNCGSDIALNDNNNNNAKDFRDVSVTLPVTLINFTAEKVEENAQLYWTTASEENNDYFLVEKSMDNVNYEEIDRVKGAGNSNVLINYQSIDYNLAEGISYYRLLQVDFDGKFSISNVVAVRNYNDNEVAIFPNPSNGEMNVETKEDVAVTLYSVSGQELANYHFQANTINKIDITNQPKGIYFLAYETNNKRVVKKLIVR